MTETPVYARLLEAVAKTDRFVSSCGGTRSGKTFANLQLIYKLAARDKQPTITSVVSETFPHLKRGAIRDFPVALGDQWREEWWSRGENVLTLPNGSIIEFFSADAPAKVHGPARDRLFLNEGQNIDYEIARQLFVRTRGLIVLDYNPTHFCWIQERIESRQDCVAIHSTYLDNPFLTAEQVREIEANRQDRNWWSVYGEGKVGTLEGLIYDFDQVDAMPEDRDGLVEVWGIDFGFNDPTAIVQVLAHTGRKEAWVREIAYSRGMKNDEIARVLSAQDIRRSVRVWSDAAEPKSIAEIADATGLNIVPCDKSAPVRSDRRKFQIQWMQGWRLHVTKDSVNLIRDLRNYCWEKDRDGVITSTPIHEWSHGPDAMRYALFSEFAQNAGYGSYNLAFNRRHTHGTRKHH